MTVAPPGRADRRAGVELLDRALAYTRAALAGVTDELLTRPTPCDRWRLAGLLAHMEDALDAFGEGAHGAVDLRPRVPAAVRVDALQRKACTLLGTWSSPVPSVVTFGDRAVEVAVVAHAAALEITVHGWDVGQATGRRPPLPEDLARQLLPVAEAFVGDGDRGVRFGAPLLVRPSGSSAERLLGFLGRASGT